MKAIFTLLCAVTASYAFAANSSRMLIKVSDRQRVEVIVDGRRYESNDNSFYFNSIKSGNHTIQVYRVNSGWMQRQSASLIYASQVYVRPSVEVSLSLNQHGEAQLTEKWLYNQNGYPAGDNNVFYNDEYNSRHTNGNQYPNYGSLDAGYDFGTHPYMSDRAFYVLLTSVKSQRFQRQKLNAAFSGIENNYVTTAQVQQLMGLFTSDADKLQLAKLAYFKTLDQNNYKRLYNVFTTAAGRNAFLQFLMLQQR